MSRPGWLLAPGIGGLIVVAIIAGAKLSGADGGSETARELQSGTARPVIEHITPRRDSVGPIPEKFEWTAVANADRYALGIWNEVDQLVFSQENITTNSLAWPRENKLDLGTYFWSVTALNKDRPIADSGLAAFVINR